MNFDDLRKVMLAEANKYSAKKEVQKNDEVFKGGILEKELIKTIEDKDKSEWIILRTNYANKIYWLLFGEIVFICLIIGLDGFGLCGFKINKWLLGSVFYGVLTHTFFLVRIIVKNLFTR